MATKRFGDNPQLQEYTGTEVIPMQSMDGGTTSESEPVAVGDDVIIPLARVLEMARRAPQNIQLDSYTVVLSDSFNLVTINSATAKDLVVPPDVEVNFPIGTRIDVGQDGVGQVTVVEGSGVTIRTPETLKLRKQWAKATLIKRGADLWDLEGNMEAVT